MPIQLSRGDPHTYTVRGIYADVGAVRRLPATARRRPRTSRIPRPAQGYLQLTPGTSVDQVLPKVEALLADNPEVSVADRASFIEQQTGQFDSILR